MLSLQTRQWKKKATSLSCTFSTSTPSVSFLMQTLSSHPFTVESRIVKLLVGRSKLSSYCQFPPGAKQRSSGLNLPSLQAHLGGGAPCEPIPPTSMFPVSSGRLRLKSVTFLTVMFCEKWIHNDPSKCAIRKPSTSTLVTFTQWKLLPPAGCGLCSQITNYIKKSEEEEEDKNAHVSIRQ